MAQMSRLSAACQPEVQAVAQSRLTPSYVRKALNPAFRAPLPEPCAAPAAQLCPGMTPGQGPVYACLYARSDRISKACSTASQAALKQAK